MSDTDHGTPFLEHATERVDDWSQAVFNASRNWPTANLGRWFRSEEGYLRLRLEEAKGEPLDPLFVVELYTSDDRINVDFGSWCTPISMPDGKLPWTAIQALAQARELVEGWFDGQVKLASYSDETGWRGSKIVYGGEFPTAIEPVPVQLGKSGRVIIKGWRRIDWRSWLRAGDGVWIECQASKPEST